MITEEIQRHCFYHTFSIEKMFKRMCIMKFCFNGNALGERNGKCGRPPVLTEEEESIVASRLMIAAEWGYPFSQADLQIFVKSYRDSKGKVVKLFRNNLPGPDWCSSFLSRQDRLSKRMCQNIKPARASVSRDIVCKYFTNLEQCLLDVPPENIINYDETNLTDDPGASKVISRKGTKRVTNILNSSKASTSIMMSCTASGRALPVYVVYKAIHLYDTWCEGGPDGALYNCTQSGWFDSECFKDWFIRVPLRYFKSCTGKKDNLASHLSADVVALCEKYDIAFVCLPPNSTHVLQPLGVAVVGPMKRVWRTVLREWKLRNTAGRPVVLPKDQFPQLLRKLLHEMQPNMTSNIRAGFQKTGIFPLRMNTKY